MMHFIYKSFIQCLKQSLSFLFYYLFCLKVLKELLRLKYGVYFKNDSLQKF